MGTAVSGFANRLDAFFGDERVDEEFQRSRLRFRAKLGWANGEGWRFSLPVRADLALPRMEERWDLFVDSMMDDDAAAAGTDLSSDLSDSVDLADRSASVGLRYTPVADERQHVSLSTGVKMRSGNLDPFISPRFRETVPLDPWRMDLTQWLFWKRKEGLGERSRVDMRTLLGEKFHFVSSSTATWSESSQGVDLSQSFTVRRMLGRVSAIAGWTRADWHTRPSAIVDGYAMGVEYRRLVYGDWLFLNVSPEFRFQNEKDYELTPALNVTLEANF